MAWFRVDDKFHSNRKVMKAGNAAVGLYVRLGAWCSDEGTNGVVPVEVMEHFGTTAQVRRLVDTGLIVKQNDEFLIPDFLEFNPSKKEVESLREERSKNGRIGGVIGAHRRHHQEKPSPDCPLCPSMEDPGDDEQEPKQTPKQVLEQNLTPQPTPNPSSSSFQDQSISSNCPDPTDGPVDKSKVEQVLQLAARARYEMSGVRATDERAYIASIERNLRDEHERLIVQRITEGQNVVDVAGEVCGNPTFARAQAGKAGIPLGRCGRDTAHAVWIDQGDGRGHYLARSAQ